MPPHMTILLIDSDPVSISTVEYLHKQHGEVIKVVAVARDFNEGVKAIQKTAPMVVVLHVSELEKGIEETKLLLSTFPHISVFVTAAKEHTDWILSLMRAGAIEYLFHPLEPSELADALQKVGRLWFPKVEPEKKRGKIISVFNPVGGMGTTTVAVNLAAALATGGQKVALVDLNLFSGDVSSFLDINPTYTLSSVTSNITRMDANFLMTVMEKHASGMYVLTEPLEVDETCNITPEHIRRILGFLGEVFPFVIVDTGGQMEGCNTAVFETSHHILYTTVLNLPSLKNTKRYIAAMERKGFQKGRVKLIVNRFSPKADIHVEDAEKVLDWKVFISIPNEYADVVESINKGIPIVTLSPRSAVSKAIVRLADMLKG